LNSLSDIQHINDTPVVNAIHSMGKSMATGRASTESIMAVNLKKLVAAGITIATGTDAGNIGTQHASSFFTEIELMQRAGMTVPQILQASTINGAKALGKENIFGSIEKGKLASMLLLSANPLENLDNWQKTELIINKGETFAPGNILEQ
jgi:imidazolonepropionase-like amidohydrolase